MKYKIRKKKKEALDYVQNIGETINLRSRLKTIMFDVSTPLGKLFDIVLLIFILASIITIILHSIPIVNARYHAILYSLDWFFTVSFLIEYILRIYAAQDRKKYIFGFWGAIDFIAVFPSIFSLLITGFQTVQVIRIIRLLRVFKVLRLFKFISEGYELAQIMKASFYKIAVFMSFIFVLVILLGSFMFVVEEGTPGFESIPSSIYWAIVTITTVGFGDITPATALGKFISSIIMLAGYAIIAVPTAIMSGAIATGNIKGLKGHRINTVCKKCETINDATNKFCTDCGHLLIK